MGLETGTTLNDFVTTNPEIADGVQPGHQHLHLIKSILQSAFGDNPNPLEFNAAWKLGGYIASAQMVKAGAAVDGITGAILGGDVGVTSVSRISAGTYEVELTETGFTFDDLHCSFNVNYLLGGIGIATMTEAQTNPTTSWVRIVTAPANDPANAADPLKFSFAIFDWNRGP